MAPLDLSTLSNLTRILIAVGLGFGFGFCLERAGFGDARRLAAQFYFTEMRVLKVMFTSIITAMLLLFWGVALGWIDYAALWVNPTYLWSGILGGFILGLGFILGGYCPGTSLVAAATLKIDGLVFVLGCLAGVFVFGEVVPGLRGFWEQHAFYGRLTLADWFGVPAGVAVFGVMCLAVSMFWGAEKLEAIFGGKARGGSS
ncbi:MAG: YeeE/YedE thiosulfate transporter family protein [bacterium]